MSDEEYCTCNRRITRELTRLLKTDYDCEDCDKKLNPDITAPCYYPRQADHADPGAPLGGAGGSAGGQNEELEQEDRPIEFNNPRSTGQVTEQNQAESGDNELWVPERLTNTGGFGPSDYTPEENQTRPRELVFPFPGIT